MMLSYNLCFSFGFGGVRPSALEQINVNELIVFMVMMLVDLLI